MASPGQKVREEVVNNQLAGLLEDYGLPNAALADFNGVPDIYLLIRGVRVILETKEEGRRAELERQMEDRLARNLCEVVVGVIYPATVVTGTLAPPTTREVRRRLQDAELTVIAMASSGVGPRFVVRDLSYEAKQLPELLNKLAGEAMPEGEIEEAITRVRGSIERFVANMSGLDAERIGHEIKKVLELGE